MSKKIIKTDVAIIGAGIIGCCLARQLSRFKLAVAVLEREEDVGWGTTKANSGILHAGYAGDPYSLKLKLTHKGNKLFKKYAQQLDIGIRNTGSLVNTTDAKSHQQLEVLYRQGKNQGIRDLDIIEGNNNIRELEPGISNQVIASLFAPSTSIVSPYEAVIAIFENARANGVSFLLGCEVDHIENSKKFRLHSKNLVVEADYVVNAAGVYADRIAAMIGDQSFTINPVRGQYFILDREVGNFVRHVNFPLTRGRQKKSKGVLVAPTMGQNLLVGPNYEQGREIDKKTTSQGLDEVRDKASHYFPDIPFKKVITSFAGVRAVADTNDFIVASSGSNQRFVNMAGIQSPGLTCSFALSEMAIDILEDSGLKLIPNRHYNPERKSIKKMDQQDYLGNNSIYKSNPGYGRIICRCEKVTEAEIVEAIRRGARTVDGIKFRTRAGMGRCQGGYCTLRVIGILARELGLPAESISKKGNGSVILGRRMP